METSSASGKTVKDIGMLCPHCGKPYMACMRCNTCDWGACLDCAEDRFKVKNGKCPICGGDDINVLIFAR
jgi:hypothetical protein